MLTGEFTTLRNTVNNNTRAMSQTAPYSLYSAQLLTRTHGVLVKSSASYIGNRVSLGTLPRSTPAGESKKGGYEGKGGGGRVGWEGGGGGGGGGGGAPRGGGRG